MQSLIIAKPVEEILVAMTDVVAHSNALMARKMDKKGFHFLSKKNYRSLSMIEKEYYNIKGKFKSQDAQTELTYEVKGNATYRIMSIVLPIMMLPTIFMGAVGGDKSNMLFGLILYLMLAGGAIFLALRQEKKLKRMGEKNFEEFLKKIN